MWRKIGPTLARYFRVIAVDLLGCGDSDKPIEGDYSISAQAELLGSLLEVFGKTPAHVVVHDVGGGVAQVLATSRPDLVRALTLINTVGYDYWPVQPIISLRIPVIRELSLAALDRGFLRVLVRRGLYHKENVTDELMKYFIAPLKTSDGRRGFLRLARCLDNRQLMDIELLIKQMKTPTLIIRKQEDAYLSEEISFRLHEDIKGSKLAVIETGGHFIQEDEPDRVAGEISEFIHEEGYLE